MAINKFLSSSKSPGRWVDHVSCVCGEKYKEFKPGITFSEAADRVRMHNEETSGGFRSRGPVLWTMRVMKLELWFDRHICCDVEPVDFPEMYLEEVVPF